MTKDSRRLMLGLIPLLTTLAVTSRDDEFSSASEPFPKPAPRRDRLLDAPIILDQGSTSSAAGHAAARAATVRASGPRSTVSDVVLARRPRTNAEVDERIVDAIARGCPDHCGTGCPFHGKMHGKLARRAKAAKRRDGTA